MTQWLTEGIQHKLLMKLIEFNYSIEYKKGKENKVVDALSRMDHSISDISLVVPAWVTEIEDNYKSDSTYADLITQLAVNSQAVPNYSLHSGILRYKGRVCVGNDEALKHKILASLHSSAIEGHSGIRVTLQRIKRIFYWPHFKKAVEEFVSECAVYQRAKGENCHYRGLLARLPIPTMAWTFISIDFVEGLPKSGGKDVILVVADRLPKYAHFIALAHPYTINSVAQLFMDHIFKLHGAPVAIVSSRGRSFASQLWQSIFKTMNVSLYFTSAYHPQSDGQTERVNQCLENYLRCMTFLESKKWVS
jgi:hypothetical protein